MPTPQIKLIIWDLDDTLWRGTLADGDRVELHAHRAALVRAFNARGVVSSICSKNDFATAQAQLEKTVVIILSGEKYLRIVFCMLLED